MGKGVTLTVLRDEIPTAAEVLKRAGFNTLGFANAAFVSPMLHLDPLQVLRVLEQVGIVSSNRVGRESHFFYIPEPIEQVRTYLDTVSMQWDKALSRLKTLVES